MAKHLLNAFEVQRFNVMCVFVVSSTDAVRAVGHCRSQLLFVVSSECTMSMHICDVVRSDVTTAGTSAMTSF